MTVDWKKIAFAAAFALVPSLGGPLAARADAPLRVELDATGAAQKFYRVKVTMPAQPGPFTFVYPQWIPGYHQAIGPIEDVVDLHVSAGGTALEWRRDLVDFYALHTTVPAGASTVEVDFAVAGAPSQIGQTAPTSSAQLAVIEYSNFVMYPQGATALGTQVEASVKLPAGWNYGTALPVQSREGDTVTFAPATLYTVVDSPVLAGAHLKEFALGPTEVLDAAADSDAGLDLAPKFLAGMKRVVQEGPALYGGRHYRHYHFLLSLSDPVGVQGIEHHESSDNRDVEKYATDYSNWFVLADLLPHEYSHSWNGKYRRPADLTPPDFQQPEKTDLLWVYEGMNQYNGEKLAARSGLMNFHDQLDSLALSAATMDVEEGRRWRPVRDLADMAPYSYSAPREYYDLRRNSFDFYTEGTLIWLDADVTIRRLTHDAKSLDDFCRLWGHGTDQTSAPVVTTYDEATVVSLLNEVVPYDWSGFFKQRIATIEPRAPLGGITGAGYKLVYTDKESELEKARDANAKHIDERFSIGMVISTDPASDGAISGVLVDSPAFRAGIAPDMKIVAVDGRHWSPDMLRDALKRHKGTGTPIELIVTDNDFYKTVKVDARDGPRYPHLERDSAVSDDELTKIYAPRASAPAPEKS